MICSREHSVQIQMLPRGVLEPRTFHASPLPRRGHCFLQEATKPYLVVLFRELVKKRCEQKKKQKKILRVKLDYRGKVMLCLE